MPETVRAGHIDKPQDEPVPRSGMTVSRYFTQTGMRPFDEIEWERRSAVITGEDGKVVFEQHNVEVPKAWSQMATNVVASKYFRGQVGTPQRESSVRQIISRVVETITGWGFKDGYFASQGDASAFADELTHLLVRQKLAFNSPVWFNVGIEPRPQCSACFLLSVEDTMDSILDWYRKEGLIFKGGSGAGVNLSPLRSSKERLARSGGRASGPVSFMRAADSSAAVIKSGGATRRAAKMVILNADHPDIADFVTCKVKEERKARALIAAGYDAGIDGEAYGSVSFQNANNSVRVTDEFMRAVIENREWQTRYVTTGEVCETMRARDLLHQIAEATWQCGDPGLQFDTTINAWHTCSASGRINTSNPCSEYLHLDNSACNLASLNLLQFLAPDGHFDTAAFKHAVDVSILAQDIIVDNSSYPTPEITANAKAFRQLGLGYANLGALLMSLGLAYDSEAGRQYAAAVTALMTGEAYLQSARLAEQMKPFFGYAANSAPMLGVIEKHRTHVHKLDPTLVPLDLLSEARKVWGEVVVLGRACGYRNAQTTLLAPTGTISFLLDCATTGIEPDLALVKYKRLVGGGMLKIINQTVPQALQRLGYDDAQVRTIVEYLDDHETIEGAPHLRDEHLPVFDCAFKPARGNRTIHYRGHLRMVGAVQPFLSGAVSKTQNMPSEATVDEIAEAYIEAWKLGLKAVAIYRDGCKQSQPLSTGQSVQSLQVVAPTATTQPPTPHRRRLPVDRSATCHKFEIAGHEGYIHVGFYEDGTPGEIFIKMAKEGSTISGLMDTIATLTSLALQYGVPLDALVTKFSHVRFEPSGFTKNPDISYAKSLTDYLFRFLGLRFLSAQQKSQTGLVEAVAPSLGEPAPIPAVIPVRNTTWQAQADSPPCADCGGLMTRAGSCYRCLECGATSGSCG